MPPTGGATRRSPSIRGQLATCALLSGLAFAITLFFQGPPAFHEWRTGQSIVVQVGVLCAVAVAGCAGSFVGLRIPFVIRRIKLPPTLATIDVSGSKPLIFGLAAGIGEELLFRAALQPLLGMIAAAAIFALVHVRTALFATKWVQRVAYLANTFVAGIVLGFLFVRVGLIAAIGVHAIIDVIGLSAMRRLQDLRGSVEIAA
jgi:membrane protease YdiL (CAAX protease family)